MQRSRRAHFVRVAHTSFALLLAPLARLPHGAARCRLDDLAVDGIEHFGAGKYPFRPELPALGKPAQHLGRGDDRIGRGG